jgi:hypothetical protein
VVALMLSLCVLVILALPLTWRRAVLVGLMIVAFLLLFPSAAVRKFFSLDLPSEVLGGTILIGIAGIAVLIVTTAVLRRLGQGPVATS